MDDETYVKHYSVAKLIEKVQSASKTASSELIKTVITLYVILEEKTVPTFIKVGIIAALGYFICPLDLIPDFLPGGFLDDLGILTATLGQVYIYRNDQVKKRVEELLPEWTR